MNRWSTEDSEGHKTILHDTRVVDRCHYKFVQTRRLYNAKSEP